jgi:hypothetical protein
MILRSTVLFCSGVAALLASVEDGVQLMQRVNAAEEARESEVTKVVSTRRYVLHNQRWDKDAVMRVRIVSQPGSGKRYEILSMETTEGLQKKIFEKILQGEVEASRIRSHQDDTRLTSANYDFVPLGSHSIEGRPCTLVALKPKRKTKYLIDGKACIDTKDNAVLRVEGKTARSVSFWIGSPHIVQSFRKVDGVWVSCTNRSTSDVRFLGSTRLTVTFEDYDIVRSGRQVARRPASAAGL